MVAARSSPLERGWLPRAALVALPEMAQHEADVRLGRAPQQRWALEHHRLAGADLPIGRATGPQDFTGSGSDEAVEHSQEQALARAVGSHDDGPRRALEGERHVVYEMPLADGVGQSTCAERQHRRDAHAVENQGLVRLKHRRASARCG